MFTLQVKWDRYSVFTLHGTKTENENRNGTRWGLVYYAELKCSHSGPRQGQVPGPIVSCGAVSVPCTTLGPGPMKYE